MEKKKFSSYAEIDQELEILKTQKELHLKKMNRNYESVKESLKPSKLVSNIPSLLVSLVTSRSVKGFGVSYLLRKIFKI